MKADTDSEIRIEPFLKWAGGKRWLTASHLDLFPKNYNTYIEPFVGSGAVFFALKPKKAILADINSELILTYKWVRKAPKLVYSHLFLHHVAHSEAHYYKSRAETSIIGAEKAARFIYLNRTCWNGLYRVNLKGEFNVPIGTKTEVVSWDEDLQLVAKQLKSAKLVSQDFEQTIKNANREDFIFADPPYTVAHNNNGFIKYNQTLFSWEDQERLYKTLNKAHQKGVKFLILNANHESIRKLYKKYCQKILSRSSILAGDSTKRGQVEEVAITNFI